MHRSNFHCGNPHQPTGRRRAGVAVPLRRASVRLPVSAASAVLALALLLLLLLAPAAVGHEGDFPEGEAKADLPAERPVGEYEVVHRFEGPMPTGVTVSRDGRIFVNFPRWGDDVPFTVAEIVDGKTVPYPNARLNDPTGGPPAERLVSVQSVVVDPADRLWILDTGRPRFQPPQPGGAKLVGVDLETGEPFRWIAFPRDVALPTTYLNDVRFDLGRGEEGMAFITDSSSEGDNALIVVDLASGKAWRKLERHPSVVAEEGFLPLVEGRPLLNDPPGADPSHMSVGSDGIALVPGDGEGGDELFFRPLSGRGLYSVALDLLADRDASPAAVGAAVVDHGDLGFASDGLEADASGNLYLTNYEDNAILVWSSGKLDTVVHGPALLWPDTLALADDGWLYFTVNQLHRQPSFHDGRDLREKPYALLRVKVDGTPVRLVGKPLGETADPGVGQEAAPGEGGAVKVEEPVLPNRPTSGEEPVVAIREPLPVDG